MPRKRTTAAATFKAKVALAAHKGDKAVNELASQFGIHADLIYARKRQLTDNAMDLFEGPASKNKIPDGQPDPAELFEQIGRLKMELPVAQKKTGPTRLSSCALWPSRIIGTRASGANANCSA